MAARRVDVNERRLRPVYDALDVMNNKQAIQLADKILKKQKDLHCAKALKSLALLRLGRPVECSALMEEIIQSQPADEPTLQAMTICFREMQKPEGIATIYDAAVKQCPQNEEFHSHLFMAYVRISDYKKQQQAAMNLYKAFPKNPYYFWSVMSIVMQAFHCNDERLSTAMLLPLAERMVEKFVNEGKIEAEAEVRLYIMILEALDKYEKAIEVLQGPLGEKLISYPLESEEKQAAYLIKLGRWAEANLMYKKLIDTVPDQWSYYQAYFNCLRTLIKDNWKPSEDLGDTSIPDHSIEQVDKFLSSLREQEVPKGGLACRGPFLAQIELEKLVIEGVVEDTRQDFKSLFDILLDYFERFGAKSCLFNDVCPYIYLLNQDQRHQFLRTLKERLEAPSKDEPQSSRIKHMYRRLNTEQLSRFVGEHRLLSVEEKIALSKEYMRCHKDGLELGSDLESTELQHSDGFALLAVHLLLDINEEKGSDEMVWHIFILLESVLKTSPSNHNVKLLLVRVYTSMGAVKSCLSLFDSLEIKHIQLDTLGYFISRYLFCLGHFESALGLYTSTLKYFFGNQKDSPEYFVAAYKFGSFEKIPEFEQFRTRLNFSVQFSMVTYEKLMLEMLQKTTSLSESQNYFDENSIIEKCPLTKEWTSDLNDNRDLRILQTWDPPDKLKLLLTSCQVFWIRLRCLILRALGLAVNLVPCQVVNDTKTDKNNFNTSLEDTTQAIEELVGEIEKHPGFHDKIPFFGPPPSHLYSRREGKHAKMVLESLKICQCALVLHHGTENKEEMCKKIVDIVKFIETTIKDNTKNCISKLTLKNGEKRMFNGHVLEPVVHLVESLSHLILLASVSCSLLHKVTTTKKAKKATSSHMVELRNSCKSYIDTIKSSTAELHSSLSEVQVTELSTEMLEMSLIEMDRE
ncbi:hypothetical protein QZH41_008359, partial [Actinostola sp. cb2023]